MILTKSPIPPHDPAGPTPWMPPGLRLLRRFSPLFPALRSGPGLYTYTHRGRYHGGDACVFIAFVRFCCGGVRMVIAEWIETAQILGRPHPLTQKHTRLRLKQPSP